MPLKECKNKKNKTYTGKEPTPLGRGYHAAGEKVGTEMKGKNGRKYKVVKYKEGKRWQLVAPNRTKKTRRGRDYTFQKPMFDPHSLDADDFDHQHDDEGRAVSTNPMFDPESEDADRGVSPGEFDSQALRDKYPGFVSRNRPDNAAEVTGFRNPETEGWVDHEVDLRIL